MIDKHEHHIISIFVLNKNIIMFDQEKQPHFFSMSGFCKYILTSKVKSESCGLAFEDVVSSSPPTLCHEIIKTQFKLGK